MENPVIPMRPGRNGGRLKTGGTNPGGGRPPDEFRREMQRLVSRAETLEKLRKVLENPDHPQWMSAVKFAAEHGYGKPHQSIGVAGTVRALVLSRVEDLPDAD